VPELDPTETRPQAQDSGLSKSKELLESTTGLAQHLPEFDIVRVEPSGDTLVAGRAEPGTQIVLLSDTKILAQTQTDSFGFFILQPEPLASGDYSLSLRMSPKDGEPRQSAQSVTVYVPEKIGGKPRGEVMVALAEPGKPTVLLSDPLSSSGTSAARDTPAKPPGLVFKTAEIDAKSGFFVSGQAPPGANLRFYINNDFIAKIIADKTGEWALKIAKGLSPGHYNLRLDQIGSGGLVTARAEIPFESPAGVGSETGANRKFQTTDLPGSKTGAVGVETDIDKRKTTIVERGDNLWRISKRLFGLGSRYTEIYSANNGQIRDPHRIYPGQIFVVPKEHEGE
jgi:hypothetical protein